MPLNVQKVKWGHMVRTPPAAAAPARAVPASARAHTHTTVADEVFAAWVLGPTAKVPKVSTRPGLQAVLFDLDGVLVDTAEFHFQAWKRLAVELGLAFDRQANHAFRGVGRMECLEKLLGTHAHCFVAEEKRLLAERKLGALALLRNLRNLQQAGVSEELVLAALASMKTGRVLPFRFLAAARSAPQWEQPLEAAMFRALEGRAIDGRSGSLPGHTVLLVDVSGSMEAPLSHRSEMRRTDAAYGLAILLREIAEKVAIYTFPDHAKLAPPRRGMALRDALEASQPHSGTMLGAALAHVEAECRSGYDRLVVITDEQSHDSVPAPRGKGYVINVASNRNGVGYGPWTHIDGWSEAVVEYIAELEAAQSMPGV